MKRLLYKLSGRKWKAPKPGRRWQDNAPIVEYLNTLICPEHETGVAGAIRAASGGKTLARGVAVGAGTGVNERALINAGLVDHFDLYEVSADRVAQAKAAASEAGMADNFSVYLEDAFDTDHPGEYDIVYWQNALHHMPDIDRALEWSVTALKPGGMLVIHDYVGPTRLQWRRGEVNAARAFLAENAHLIEVDRVRVKYGTPFRRFKQFWRDPSEAPHSDKIEASYTRHTGDKLHILGGSMIHLCAGFIVGLEHKDPEIQNRLIRLDQQMRDKGIYHFAFGLWTKPA